MNEKIDTVLILVCVEVSMWDDKEYSYDEIEQS